MYPIAISFQGFVHSSSSTEASGTVFFIKGFRCSPLYSQYAFVTGKNCHFHFRGEN